MKRVTNSCYLDTNILLYYQDWQSPFYQQTQEMISKLIKGGLDLIISPLVLDEYIYNTFTSSYKAEKEKIKMITLSLREILKLPGIKIFNPPLEVKKQLKVLKLMEKFGLKPRDAYHLLITLENKIKYLATFDSDFEKVFALGRVKKFE
ncbi:MAG: PilT protein domain protein [Candidatus Daviesbacteria bacterium GW2011_GWA1_41_61]|uniref:PilT protein domain protein n=1 Tax=Candidatus Daviesbacteria bacterium GW2011_GWA2_40_9 TaxID=1618424 RepID=A0A0G0U3N3_9BACT|nr:MAG: PilT protein domain protein [Candidatus Daviesbacteria bacterium GW2011_GWC1_40_9]KKR83703.1 MAG: PilT protein domain protein [Candidatus Daviesbacteria bacterium GW2011_GWA2_40_9]KKR93701.1 MAG: PilT protein domain protein [Candidatus Daviesbacteria bacterium GW2011_GWB1_41_15]KKS15167.1 MAG: PilT protein domain protein [Candidatus Daviesbacteria bacterium GW2011_GWA1_41_61]